MRKVDLQRVASSITAPFTHAVLEEVDDYRVYLSRFEGTYVFHRHPGDELYLVLEGEIAIDFLDGPTVALKAGEAVVARAGQVHRSRSEKGALVLMFKAKGLPSEVVAC